jgi:hypothetical protein
MGFVASGTKEKEAVGVMLFNTQKRHPIRWETVPGTWNSRSRRERRSVQSERSPIRRVKRMRDNTCDDDGNDDEGDDDGEEEDYYDETDNAQSPDFLPYPTDASTTHELLPLEPPSVSALHKIRAALSGEIDLVSLYGRDGGDNQTDAEPEGVVGPLTSSKDQPPRSHHNHLYEALLVATDTIRKHNKDKGTVPRARIWIFTNHPAPCGKEKEVRVVAGLLRDLVQDADKLFRCRSIVVWPVDDNPLEEYREQIGMLVAAPLTAAAGCVGDNDDDNFCDDDYDGLLDQLRWEWTRDAASSAAARPKWRRIPLIRPDWNDDPKGEGRPDRNGDSGTCRDDSSPHPPSGILLDWYDLVSRSSPPLEKEVHAYTGQYVLTC